MTIYKFLSYYTILLALTALSFLGLHHYVFNQNFLIPHFWLVFGYMGAITFIVYYLSIAGIKYGGENQGAILLSAIVLRMLFTLAFILVYTLKIKVEAVLFVANFFSIYLLFTVFEIYCLLCNLRHQNKK